MKQSIVIVQTFLLSLGLLIASTVLSAQFAIANPRFPTTDFMAQVQNGDVNAPKTKPADNSPSGAAAKDKSTENLSNPPQAKDKTANSAQNSQQTQSEGPYDMKAIEEFYKSLYGS